MSQPVLEFNPDSINPQALARDFGVAAITLKRNPDLQEIFQKILDDLKAGISYTAEDIQAMVANSNWARNNFSAYLEAEKDRAEKDPQFFEDLMNLKAESIMRQYEQAGATIDPVTARDYAEKLYYTSGRNEAGELQIYDEQWLADQVAGAIDFNQTQTINGVQMYDLEGLAGKNAETLYNLAYQYGIDSSMSNQAFDSFFRNSIRSILNGDRTSDDVKLELQDMAVSRFPGLANQIKRGLSVREAADPYLRAIATELELGEVDLNDNLAQAVLNSVDADGNFKPMSIYEAKLAARRDPRWQYTETAKNEYTDIASMIARDFGFLA